VSDDERGGAPISIPVAAKGRVRPFEPTDLVVVNDAVVRIAAIEGEFPWHHHDEDELFLCWDGGFRIEFRDGEPVELVTGDLYVIPEASSIGRSRSGGPSSCCSNAPRPAST
jgi:mannose-6-phosphate isomerase-like protein (cupin superfamily)